MRWPWKRRSRVVHWKVDPDDAQTNDALDAYLDGPLGSYDSLTAEQALAFNETMRTGRATVVDYDDRGRLRVRHLGAQRTD